MTVRRFNNPVYPPPQAMKTEQNAQKAFTHLAGHFRTLFRREKDPLTDILGQDPAKEQVKAALLMDRHIIIVGPPGVGKTTLARNLARILPELQANDCPYHCNPLSPICPQCISAKSAKKKLKTRTVSGEERFIRLQGSPDLTAEDLIGDIDPLKALEFGPMSIEAFTLGKLFKANNGVLFFDEINRCPQKLQNALLQVLSEGKVTIGAYDVDVPATFIFIGTMNPEDTNTEPLSAVFKDRFDQIHMSYPESQEIEEEITVTKGKKLVEFPRGLLTAMLEFVRHLRLHKDLENKPSVRASIGLYERAQAHAYLAERDTVAVEDIEAAVISVLAHRVKLRPNKQYVTTPEDFIRNEFRSFSQKLSTDKQGGHLQR